MTKLQGYFIAVGWFLLSLVSSAANDIIAKYMGMRLHSFEVACFRFLFSVITLIPVVAYYGMHTLKTEHIFIHIIRGALLFFGIASWTYGLTIVPVSTATIVSFAVPLFTLVLAVFFLNENIIWQRWFVTIIGFIGIAITLQVQSDSFNYEVLIFIFASVAFAGLDVINKKFVVKESMISMLFYSSLVTSVLAMPPAYMYWVTPNAHELLLLFILGASANVILFLLLKAFALADATALAPYRYFELFVSASAAYLLFGELPEKGAMYGAAIIIPATLFIVYSERKTIDNAKNKSDDNIQHQSV